MKKEEKKHVACDFPASKTTSFVTTFIQVITIPERMNGKSKLSRLSQSPTTLQPIPTIIVRIPQSK
uniref:Putative ovule protein n=1 Tax=Solanum chacoense TaxID=4108 RepID=A0A0V0HIJ8_SOLCH